MKVFDADESNKDKVKWLNFNKKINYIAAGAIMPSVSREVLIVASDNSVTAYGR